MSVHTYHTAGRGECAHIPHSWDGGVSVHTYCKAGMGGVSVHTYHTAEKGKRVCIHTTQLGRGVERSLIRLSFLLLPCGSPGNELRSSDLAASSFIHNGPTCQHIIPVLG